MRTWFRPLRQNPRACRASRRPVVEALEQRCLLDAGYLQTNLVSSVRGLAPHTNPGLINPWGFSETPDGQFRVSANGSGEALLFDAHGNTAARPVILPTPSDSPPGSTSAPNGNVFNTTSDFVIGHGGRSAPATVLFSTEDGTIVGINPKVDKTQGVIGSDQSDSGAVYKLLAAGAANGANYLYATDFHNDKIDVFDGHFHKVALGTNGFGTFTDPTTGALAIPAGFAPFGVKNINGTLFVTYAKQLAPDNHDDQEGPGNGFINEFDTQGHFLMRFATGTAAAGGPNTPGTLAQLNSPIGMAVAPANFGKFSNDLLVGNFGDSHVNAFDLKTGAFLGQLADAHGNPLVLNGGFKETNLKGLWGIGFGNGADGAATNTLFFAAGINAESAGLFGKVTVADGDHDRDDRAHADSGGDARMSTATSSGMTGSMGRQDQDGGQVRAALAEVAQALEAIGSGPVTAAESQALRQAVLDLVFAELEADSLR